MYCLNIILFLIGQFVGSQCFTSKHYNRRACSITTIHARSRGLYKYTKQNNHRGETVRVAGRVNIHLRHATKKEKKCTTK